MNPIFDKFLGRIREADEINLNVDTSGITQQYIQELINNSTINFDQIIGSPTTNTELVSYINNLVDLLELNNFEAGQIITQEMKTYFDTLLSQLTITVDQITNLDTVNAEFKTYIDDQLTILEDYLTQVIVSEEYTNELKTYIDNQLSIIETSISQLVKNTVNNELREYIEQNSITLGESTRLISGTVTHIVNLDFLVSSLVYRILNAQYQSAETLVTIPENVDANPRFAVLVADVFGNVGYVLGNSAENPAIPLIDSAAQIAIQTIYIPANSNAPGTDPGGETGEISTETIYTENVEWATAKTEEAGLTIDFEAATAPQSGDKHIKLTMAEGAALYEKSALITGPATQDGKAHVLAEPLAGNLTLPLVDIFADHKTDAVIGTVRHLVYYRFDQLNKITASLKSVTTGQSYRLMPLSATNNDQFVVGGLGFSANVPGSVTFRSGSGQIPAGNYVLIASGFTRYDQQYLVTTFPTFKPSAALISFTRAEAIEAKGGKISLFLKTLAPWLTSTGLLFEIFNGAKKVGMYAMIPGAYSGFNSQNDDYQRVTIPIDQFTPSETTIDRLTLRPIGTWPNSSLYIDNVTLQTGTEAAAAPDKYLEAAELDGEGKLTLKRSAKLPDIEVQFAKAAKTGSYNDLGDKPTIPAAQVQTDWNQANNAQPDYLKNKPTLGSIAAKNFWTGTEAAYTAINPKDANTIYFVEEA